MMRRNCLTAGTRVPTSAFLRKKTSCPQASQLPYGGNESSDDEYDEDYAFNKAVAIALRREREFRPTNCGKSPYHTNLSRNCLTAGTRVPTRRRSRASSQVFGSQLPYGGNESSDKKFLKAKKNVWKKRSQLPYGGNESSDATPFPSFVASIRVAIALRREREFRRAEENEKLKTMELSQLPYGGNESSDSSTTSSPRSRPKTSQLPYGGNESSD